jgi:hypothetical protein
MVSTQRVRWSDDDTHFGPFLYANDKYRNFAVVLDSGDDEEHNGCTLRVSALGHTLIVSLPPIIKPWKKKVFVPSWRTDGTAERLGRDWYFDSHEREYGFSYSGSGSIGDGGFLQIFLGPQTMNSSTTKSWSCFTPWNNWRHVRHSVYGLDGNLYATEPTIIFSPSVDRYALWREMQDTCPSRTFSFTDFDGELLTAKTRIEEREWRYGTGWFKWLSWFRKPLIRRSLDIEFSGETGRKKGSWKGGTTGHSIDMLPGELHEAAFRRYCAGEDRNGKMRDMVFGGEV